MLADRLQVDRVVAVDKPASIFSIASPPTSSVEWNSS